MRNGKSVYPLALVLAAGLVLAVLAPAGPALAQAGWRLESTAGFGLPGNSIASASAVFNSRLYVGTENVGGLEIFSYDGENWTQEVGWAAAGPNAPGFGNGNNTSVASMACYGPHLYVGTSNQINGCEVWRYDGNAWTSVVGGTSIVPPGFGNPGNWYASAMELYGPELWVGTFSWGGCEIWRYDTTGWVQEVGGSPSVTAPAGFGTGCIVVRTLQVYGTDLFVGTGSPVGGEVWSFNGVGWTPWASANPAAPLGTGFGNAANTDVMDMAVYGGFLYAGTSNGANPGCELWVWDNVNWTQIVGNQPTALYNPGFGNPNNIEALRLEVYDSRLYIGTTNLTGCNVISFDGAIGVLEVGGGAPGTYEAPGFGDANNTDIRSAAVFNDRLYMGTANWTTGCDVLSLAASTTWYLAEGATLGGFETWVLVQNPNPTPANIEIKFQTDAGPVPAPGDPPITDTIPANSRRSYLVNNYVSTFDVSTTVKADTDIICERSMYWTPAGSTVRRVGHDSIGVLSPSSTWYLAEGATLGGFETWVLVQNPNPAPVNVDVKFQTGTGEVQGPQEALAGNSRKSYLVNNYVSTFDVSTRVDSYMGDVVCERAVYYTPPNGTTRELGHDSIGVVSPSDTWYLAEGATAGGFENWVLVQNPNPVPVNIDMKFQTATGEVAGPVDTIPALSRESYLVDNYVNTFDVSTRVNSTGGAVICERAMYESPTTPGRRLSGHDSIGTTVGGREWFLPEGATTGGFETWVLVQNPNNTPVDIDIRFQTGGGEVAGPVDTIPAFSRKSYLVNTWVATFDVSTKVTSNSGGYIICERAVYWRPTAAAIRYLATDSIGYRP